MSTTTQRRPLTSRVVRPGCQVMKLDTANSPMVFEPKTWSKKGRTERQGTINAMRQIGDVSMVKIGPDEYRSLNRAERRRRGQRSQKNVLAVIAAKTGTVAVKRPIELEATVQLAAARHASATLRSRTYTRKAKGQRKAIVERNSVVSAMHEQLKVCDLVHRARGFVGVNPIRQAMEVQF
jgi:hypothetical protein